VIVPRDYQAVQTRSAMVAKDAVRPDLARSFLAFLISPEGGHRQPHPHPAGARCAGQLHPFGAVAQPANVSSCCCCVAGSGAAQGVPAGVAAGDRSRALKEHPPAVSL
jgi:hypothetical protein